ncbi:MAG: hypothetical protein HY899_02425 [Deltaproteobacteria bacterium]|nr:hypothetical protein [Deltaproteobacteria bacterium]
MKHLPQRTLRRAWLALATALALAPAPTPVLAGSTDPVLVIGQAGATGNPAAELVELTGAWGFDDILQLDFPLGIVVRQGAVFALFSPAQTAKSGTFAALGDGLAAGEIAGLEASASPDAAAALLRLGAHEITLQLPPVFAAGDVSVVLYVVLPAEGTFLSNEVTAAVQQSAP